MDTTQATAANRVKVWVNGAQVTSFSTATYPSLNLDTYVNNTTAAGLGASFTGSWGQFLDGYLTEVNFIDGQQLAASSFGENDAITGVWKPKKYTGTYGTNGFYVNFSDPSAATAAAIGKDYSGNGNNWTPNNISVTAGTTYDSMLDVPTLWADGGNGRGNYPVWNPLKVFANNLTISDGNLSATNSSSTVATQAVASMRLPATGKWYWEVTNVSGSGLNCFAGMATTEAVADSSVVTNNLGGYRSNGAINNLAGTAQTSGASYTAGDVIAVAVDVDAGTVQFYKNGAAQGATPSFTFTAGTIIVPAIATDNSAGTKTFAGNFGQRPFTYTPPTGFKSLNTQNLPDATIKKGNQYFDATTYTGDGTSSKAVVNSGAFQPDMVWLKVRNVADNNSIADAVRGAPALIYPNLTSVETAAPLQGSVGSFNSNGFTIAAGATNNANFNTNANTYVAWQWKKGATPGFDIVTYTGDGTTNRTVAHSLGVQPSMFIIKPRTIVASWIVHHKDLGNNGGSPAYLNYVLLESTAAKAASTTMIPVAGLSSTTFPTSGATNNTNVNGSGTTYVAYLFAEVAGFSKFGSYTGNGSADGPFVYCGFRPRYVMLKSTTAARDWLVYDTARGTYNVLSEGPLQPNTAGTPYGAGYLGFDILSNGFKLRESTTNMNASGETHIFMAFAENPFKNALAR